MLLSYARRRSRLRLWPRCGPRACSWNWVAGAAPSRTRRQASTACSQTTHPDRKGSVRERPLNGFAASEAFAADNPSLRPTRDAYDATVLNGLLWPTAARQPSFDECCRAVTTFEGGCSRAGRRPLSMALCGIASLGRVAWSRSHPLPNTPSLEGQPGRSPSWPTSGTVTDEPSSERASPGPTASPRLRALGARSHGGSWACASTPGPCGLLPAPATSPPHAGDRPPSDPRTTRAMRSASSSRSPVSKSTKVS